jgi:acyl-coenzyme A thioesterase PaaI-like protein
MRYPERPNYVRAARGDELIARAEVVHAGSALVTVRCDIFDRHADGEYLCAIAQGTIARR